MLIVPRPFEEGNWLMALRLLDVHPPSENMRSTGMKFVVKANRPPKKYRRSGSLKEKPLGNGLLSQAASSQVPSALTSLTSGFEMGPGVPPPL